MPNFLSRFHIVNAIFPSGGNSPWYQSGCLLPSVMSVIMRVTSSPTEKNSRPSGVTSHHLPSTFSVRKLPVALSFGPFFHPPKRSHVSGAALRRGSSAARSFAKASSSFTLKRQSACANCPYLSTNGTYFAGSTRRPASGSPSSRRLDILMSARSSTSSSYGHCIWKWMEVTCEVSMTYGPRAPSGAPYIEGCASRRRIVPFSPGLRPMPVLTERFFLNIAVAWSPESPSATPAETCIVRRDWRVFERFSTSTDSHFADEKSTPSSDVHLSPVPHSALGNLTRTQFAPSRSTFAL